MSRTKEYSSTSARNETVLLYVWGEGDTELAQHYARVRPLAVA
jgi:hypothetical protein